MIYNPFLRTISTQKSTVDSGWAPGNYSIKVKTPCGMQVEEKWVELRNSYLAKIMRPDDRGRFYIKFNETMDFTDFDN